MGVKSRRDHFLIDQERETLQARMARLSSARNVETLREELQVTDNPQWTLKDMRDLVRREGVDAGIVAITYRPFDRRFIWYHREAIERGDARWPVMRNVLPDGLSLLTSRQSVNHDFTSAFVVRGLSEMKTAESTRGSYVFPIRQASDRGLLKASGKVSNLRAEGLSGFLSTLTPEEMLFYVYSVLHSGSYRRRYAGALQIEFPKIPPQCSGVLGKNLCRLGEELVALHLMESPELGQFITK
jgi:predicted helicase